MSGRLSFFRVNPVCPEPLSNCSWNKNSYSRNLLIPHLLAERGNKTIFFGFGLLQYAPPNGPIVR